MKKDDLPVSVSYPTGAGVDVPKCNPQSATVLRRGSSRRILTTQTISNAVLNSMEDEVKNLMEKTVCQVALVIDHTQMHDASISSVRNPVSTCNVTTVVVLSDKGTEAEKAERAKRWLYSHGLVEDTTIVYGEAGFQSVLQDSSIYALYISVAAPTQHGYIMASLQAQKHVLLNDTESTPYDEFLEQSACAQATNSFLQFTTMFSNDHRCKNFWECVTAPHTFGSIRRVEAILSVNVRDLPLIQVPYPLLPQHGCIRRLARFAVLVTTLILMDSRDCSCEPLSATVTDWVRDAVTREPVAATCVVEFAGPVTLHCQVEFSRGATRQVLTVQSTTNTFATMTDFVIPHPDGLTNYRVYHKRGCDSSSEEGQPKQREEILQGSCLDVPRAVPHNVTQWREFHRLCRLVDDTGPKNAEAQRFANASLATKRVLLALDESYDQQQQQQHTSDESGEAPPITIPCCQD